VSAGKLHSLSAAGGGDNLIAMRFEQIGEELHIELIIFDDENRLGH